MCNKRKKKHDDNGKNRERIDEDENGTRNDHEQNDKHEMHLWTERERRKKMRIMFANLHALLPQLPPKADKSSIVDQAVKYIKTLQNTLQRLEKQKQERQLQAVASAASLNINREPPMMLIPSRLTTPSLRGLDTSNWQPFLADDPLASRTSSSFAAGTISVPQLPVTFQTWISSNVVLNVCGNNAQITVCSTRKLGLFSKICFVLEQHKIEVISAHVSSDANRTIYMIQAHVCGKSDRLWEIIPAEEVYKQAALEIMLWVSS